MYAYWYPNDGSGHGSAVYIVTDPWPGYPAPAYSLPVHQPTEEMVDEVLTEKGWRRTEPWRNHGAAIKRITADN